uniref:Uncharacterized protein n=1 Tax=Mesocestoides corti TaxID=53468 RepID=A0A5K3EIV4_MESCO
TRAQTCWTTWPQPIPCLSPIQWHAGKEGSQPERGMDEMQARVFYSGVGLGRRHAGPPGRSQSRVSLCSNGMRGR